MVVSSPASKVLAGALLFLGLAGWPPPVLADDLDQRLAAGQIVASCDAVAGAALKQGQAIGVVAAPPHLVWQVITDVDHFRDFMPRTLKSQSVPPERLRLVLAQKPQQAAQVEAILGSAPAAPPPRAGGKYEVYLYSLLDFPWPLAQRWYIIKLIQDETQAAAHRYVSTWTLEIGNLRENRGEWRLEPFGDRHTRVTYRLFSDPGCAVPPLLLKRGTLVTLPQIIEAVRKRVAAVAPQPHRHPLN